MSGGPKPGRADIGREGLKAQQRAKPDRVPSGSPTPTASASCNSPLRGSGRGGRIDLCRRRRPTCADAARPLPDVRIGRVRAGERRATAAAMARVLLFPLPSRLPARLGGLLCPVRVASRVAPGEGRRLLRMATPYGSELAFRVIAIEARPWAGCDNRLGSSTALRRRGARDSRRTVRREEPAPAGERSGRRPCLRRSVVDASSRQEVRDELRSPSEPSEYAESAGSSESPRP